MKQLLFIIFSIVFVSCANTPKNLVIDPEINFGWLHGNCLAIKNPNITVPQEMTLVKLEQTNVIGTGTIIKRARSGVECYPLLDDRKQVNKDNGYFFYLVESKSPINLAIGFFRLDDPGSFDFSFCTTTEGVLFSVSKRKSVIWKGYYYLGYESEATCEEESNPKE